MPILAFERRERKENKVPDQRPEESKRKFPIKEWKRAKRKKEKRKSPIKDQYNFTARNEKDFILHKLSI